jgi:hypothetical protein
MAEAGGRQTTPDKDVRWSTNETETPTAHLGMISRSGDAELHVLHPWVLAGRGASPPSDGDRFEDRNARTGVDLALKREPGTV